MLTRIFGHGYGTAGSVPGHLKLPALEVFLPQMQGNCECPKGSFADVFDHRAKGRLGARKPNTAPTSSRLRARRCRRGPRQQTLPLRRQAPPPGVSRCRPELPHK